MPQVGEKILQGQGISLYCQEKFKALKSGKSEILKVHNLLFSLSWCVHVQVMESLESHEIFKNFIFQALNVILHFVGLEVFTV